MCGTGAGWDAGLLGLLLQVLECVLKKICDVFLEEIFVGCSCGCLVWCIDRFLDFAGFDEQEHARQ